MKISLIQPGRNNLKYLKWSYDSIRKNQGEHEVEICVADDASTDGTWDWCLEMMDKDPLFKAHRNEGPDRLGHTILYDTLINDVATNDIAMIYHADMYLCPNALTSIEKHIKPGTIVSLTRIEPPLHPQGPEKILWNGGVEPEEFKEQDLLDKLKEFTDTTKTTGGIFAPWAFYRKDFQEIGGHDPLYAPQSKEDSDIFNRFQLKGIKFIQTWEGFVYHMTCRGSRRNTLDKAKNIYEDSPEWLAQNQRSTRNFIRKWGHFVMHDPLLVPIVPPKYDVGFIVKNCNSQLLNALEPWCNTIYVDESSDRAMIDNYITLESPNTIMDLYQRIKPFDNEKNNEILVEIDGNAFRQNDFVNVQRLSQIIESSGEVGKFELENLSIEIIQMNEYTKDLIKL
jgi:glycosyltransferase involved in cell wall biosynthesis